MQNSILASAEESTKDAKPFKTRGAAQAEIEAQTAAFLKDDGNITHLPGLGVVATTQAGYKGKLVPKVQEVRKLTDRQRFDMNARSCFSRGQKGAAIHVFKLDDKYHFRHCKSRAPEGSELFKTFKSMVEVLKFKLP